MSDVCPMFRLNYTDSNRNPEPKGYCTLQLYRYQMPLNTFNLAQESENICFRIWVFYMIISMNL